MPSDRTRDLIIQRRARFVAAAIATAGISAGAASASSCCPQTCLEPAIDMDATPPPSVCLAVPTTLPSRDAGADAEANSPPKQDG